MSDFKYTVKSGDTLSKISAAYTIGGSAYAVAIANYNNIDNPNLIQVGQTINIPDNWLKPQYQTASTVTPSLPVDFGVNTTGGWGDFGINASAGKSAPQTMAARSAGNISPATIISTVAQKKSNITTWLLVGAAGLLLVGIFLRRK